MKRLIYMLLLFVVLGHTVFAQEQKAEPLEVRLLDGFFPLGADWYRAQKDAWQVELKKDKRNEKAWENYWVACNAEYQEAKLVWWKDSLQVQRLRREQHGIVKKMKKWIPDTRTYYRHLLDLETDEGKREVIQQKILSIKRTSERDYISDLTYYHHKKDMDKIKELAREWYDSGLFSHAFLFYFYNECSGLKKDAILVSDLNLGTYYRYLLQYGIGLFTDVKVVDVAAGSGNRCANASGCKDGEMSWIVVFCRKRETSCVLYAFFLLQRFIGRDERQPLFGGAGISVFV